MTPDDHSQPHPTTPVYEVPVDPSELVQCDSCQ